MGRFWALETGCGRASWPSGSRPKPASQAP